MSELEINQYNIWFIKMHIVYLFVHLNNRSRKVLHTDGSVKQVGAGFCMHFQVNSTEFT